jgi:hypothetical protein
VRIRIYYNRTSDQPWSFDFGAQDSERQCSDWRLYDVDAAAGQDLTVPAGDRERPRVWIELKSVIGYDVMDDVLCVYGSTRA